MKQHVLALAVATLIASLHGKVSRVIATQADDHMAIPAEEVAETASEELGVPAEAIVPTSAAISAAIDSG